MAQLNYHTINGFIYLQVSISGLANIFVTRTPGFSFLSRPSTLLIAAFIFAQIAASLVGGFGFPGVPPECTPVFCPPGTDDGNTWVFKRNTTYATNVPYVIMQDNTGHNLTFCVDYVPQKNSTIYYRKEFTTEVWCDPSNLEIVPHLGGCGAAYVLAAWIWCLGWFWLLDWIKFGGRWLMKGGISYDPTYGISIKKNPVRERAKAPEIAPIVFHSRMSLDIQGKRGEPERPPISKDGEKDSSVSSREDSSGVEMKVAGTKGKGRDRKKESSSSTTSSSSTSSS